MDRSARILEAPRIGNALLTVWDQARENHGLYSAQGSAEADISFLTLGLAGETGEVLEAMFDAMLMAASAGKIANFVKKRWRDQDEHGEAIQKEIADCLAYAFMLADRTGLTPLRLLEIVHEKQLAFVDKMKARDAARAGSA